jgi:predicted lipoprotein with Yx(FWY)xxD motif
MNRRLAMRAIPLTAAVLATALVGVALAKTFTLKIASHGTVRNQSNQTTHTPIVVNSAGWALYWLTGDSAKHPECTGPCLKAWPPLTVKSKKSLSAVKGITGKLGIWTHNGMNQVTDGGHPLYRYVGDNARRDATGEGIQFSNTEIWHVRTPKGKVVSFGSTTAAPNNNGGGGGGW